MLSFGLLMLFRVNLGFTKVGEMNLSEKSSTIGKMISFEIIFEFHSKLKFMWFYKTYETTLWKHYELMVSRYSKLSWSGKWRD